MRKRREREGKHGSKDVGRSGKLQEKGNMRIKWAREGKK